MLSRREYWEHRKYRNTIFGLWKSLRWLLYRMKMRIIFWYRKKVARTGTP
ncbi:MAG: hypothetical protein A4E34_00210 [Methanoregula sp. PtaU1.Bin006]|nr:MAG: hypothetical protein A4E34_00210 [Methanoregula sp. PtaU1.Bin006]